MLAPNEVLEKIKRRALEITADLERKLGPYRAEIIPGAQAAWHIVTTYASNEEKAADYLADRGIGVFVPRFAEGSTLRIAIPKHEQRRERACYRDIDLGEKLIFPGRVLVFVWDVRAHWRRIRACPGVAAIMVDQSECPIAVKQLDIAWIQALQFSLVPQPKEKRDRYSKRSKNNDMFNDIITISTKSYWVEDGAERTRLLDKELALPTTS